MGKQRLIEVSAVALVFLCGHALGSDPEAEALMRETSRRYQAMGAYSDTVDVTTRMVVGRIETPVSWTITTSGSLVFDRDGRIAYRSASGDVVCDGQTLWKTDSNGGRYTEDEAPQPLRSSDLKLEGGAATMLGGSNDSGVHPLLALMSEEFADLGTPLTGDSELVGVREATAEGHGSKVITIRLDAGQSEDIDAYGLDEETLSMLPMAELEVWIDAKTGLIWRIDRDSGEFMRAVMQAWSEESGFGAMMPQYQAVKTSWVFSNIQVDAEAADAAFAFDPGQMELVDSFEMDWDMMPDFDTGGGGVEGAEFVHQPAPPIAGETLTGQTFSLEDMKGRVVLVDFWATWCGPCVAAIPEIQKISEEFAGKDLVVVGINQDVEEMRDDVVTFLDEKKITFRQILDADDEIGGRYNVNAIPTTVLIDREGVVQAYHVGFGGADVYREEIRRVLAGEQLEAPQPPPPAVSEELFVHADAIQVVESRGAPVTAWEGRYVDLPEGRTLVVPADEGGLMKFNKRSREFERINLEEGDEQRMVIGFAPVMKNGAVDGWVLANDSAYDYSDLEIVFHDATGRIKWTAGLGVDPASESGYEACIEAADITGDDEPEVVVFANVMSQSDFEGRQMLLVLDKEGRIICRGPVQLDGLGAMEIIPGGKGKQARIVLFGLSEMISVEIGL